MMSSNPLTTPAVSLQQTLGGPILHAYHELQRARADGNYAAICRWQREVDKLLDRWNEIKTLAS